MQDNHSILFTFEKKIFFSISCIFFIQFQAFNQQNLPNVVVQKALEYKGCPYQANGLTTKGKEVFTYTFESFDCVTLVETALAQSLAILDKDSSIACFEEKLILIRYKNGTSVDYGNRNHYFTSWIHNIEKLGLGKDITATLGGIKDNKTINFISSNSQFYPNISDPKVSQLITDEEKRISKKDRNIIPSHQVKSIIPKLKEGDIIGFTTSTPGLDVSHVGVIKKGPYGTHFLHASERHNKVGVSPTSIDKYITTMKNVNGIIVLRLE